MLVLNNENGTFFKVSQINAKFSGFTVSQPYILHTMKIDNCIFVLLVKLSCYNALKLSLTIYWPNMPYRQEPLGCVTLLKQIVILFNNRWRTYILKFRLCRLLFSDCYII